MKILTIAILVIFLHSCAAKNNSALALYHADLPTGTTSFKIVQKFGIAPRTWKVTDEYVATGYSYSKPVYKFSSFLPLPLFNSEFVNYEVVLVFDKKAISSRQKNFLITQK